MPYAIRARAQATGRIGGIARSAIIITAPHPPPALKFSTKICALEDVGGIGISAVDHALKAFTPAYAPIFFSGKTLACDASCDPKANCSSCGKRYVSLRAISAALRHRQTPA
jgi:hypothetical protein